jgi:hypothetical protein
VEPSYSTNHTPVTRVGLRGNTLSEEPQ